MHSRAKIVGTVCKCMDCAKERWAAVRKEAAVRYPNTLAVLDHELVEAERLAHGPNARLSDQDALKDVRHREYKFLREVYEEINAEADAGDS